MGQKEIIQYLHHDRLLDGLSSLCQAALDIFGILL